MQQLATQQRGVAWHRPRVRDAARAIIHRRAARPLIGMVGVPLALVAALCSDQWWTLLPLNLCAWWWCPREWGWEWLVAVGRGVIAAEWAYIGAGALATFPSARAIVACVWIGVPLVLAASKARRPDERS